MNAKFELNSFVLHWREWSSVRDDVEIETGRGSCTQFDFLLFTTAAKPQTLKYELRKLLDRRPSTKLCTKNSWTNSIREKQNKKQRKLLNNLAKQNEPVPLWMSLVPFMQTFKSNVGYVHVAKHEYDCNQSSGLIILKRGQILVH